MSSFAGTRKLRLDTAKILCYNLVHLLVDKIDSYQKRGQMMATYEYEKLWLEYEADRMDMEMAFGHTLQHVGKLYEANRTVATVQRTMQEQLAGLTTELKTLRSEIQRAQKPFETDGFQRLADGLATCKRAITTLQAEVDRLLTHTKLPNAKIKAKPSKPEEAHDPEQPS